MGQFEINGNLGGQDGLSNFTLFLQTVCDVRAYLMTHTLGIIQYDIDIYVDNGTKNTGYVPIVTPIFGKFLIIKLGITGESLEGQIAYQFAHEYMHCVFYGKYGLQKTLADDREETICSATSLIVLHDMYPAFFGSYVAHVRSLTNAAYKAGADLAAEVNYDIDRLVSLI